MPFPAPFRLPALCKSCSKVSSQPFCSHVPNPTNHFLAFLLIVASGGIAGGRAKQKVRQHKKTNQQK